MTRDIARMSVAKLDSHGSDLFGVLVPVPESDFSYRSPLFGAELTLKKSQTQPRPESPSSQSPTDPSVAQCEGYETARSARRSHAKTTGDGCNQGAGTAAASVGARCEEVAAASGGLKQSIGGVQDIPCTPPLFSWTGRGIGQPARGQRPELLLQPRQLPCCIRNRATSQFRHD